MKVPPLAHLLSVSADRLMAPPPGLAFDFSEPRGEPALVTPNSVSWRIFKNPIALVVGGVAAVILELAEPVVRTGVWTHSSFRTDAATRLRRTGFAAMMTVYGPRSAAERMIASIVRRHERVRGEAPDGTPYHANDPRLLGWVQATAAYGFIEAYHRYVVPLSEAERSRAFAEGEAAARLYGALGAPTSLAAWRTLLAATEPRLEPHPILTEFLDIMRRVPLLPAPLRAAQRLLVAAAVDLVPEAVRARLGLRGAGAGPAGRALVRAVGRGVDRVPLLRSPPARASVRMGLPADHLWR
jgi:uncharacterized protein (DUF2236 family)